MEAPMDTDLAPWEPTVEEEAAFDRRWFDRDDDPEPDDYDG